LPTLVPRSMRLSLGLHTNAKTTTTTRHTRKHANCVRTNAHKISQSHRKRAAVAWLVRLSGVWRWYCYEKISEWIFYFCFSLTRTRDRTHCNSILLLLNSWFAYISHRYYDWPIIGYNTYNITYIIQKTKIFIYLL